ncbi:LolA family protein [Celeribacter sp.]|uniref:LolA family protein n=1 Tax=Celeribacter sp. TaxID=1890673 RepID=UPI003A8E64CC
MSILRFAIAPVFALAIAFPASAEKLSLSELSSYLNGLGTVEAEFTQINDDGSRSQGTLTIKRPGRMRLEYADSEALVVTGGGQVAIFDPGSNEPPQRFPLSQTPLSLILKRNVDLTAARMVVSHTEKNGDTFVRAQDPDHPEYGSIDLIFGDRPILKAWIVNDDAGGSTTVQLTKMRLGGKLSDALFNITRIARDRGTPVD